jgi:hypothetical protein
LNGAVAQLGEHLLCKQGVTGSIPVSSTIKSATEMKLFNVECHPMMTLNIEQQEASTEAGNPHGFLGKLRMSSS